MWRKPNTLAAGVLINFAAMVAVASAGFPALDCPAEISKDFVALAFVTTRGDTDFWVAAAIDAKHYDAIDEGVYVLVAVARVDAVGAIALAVFKLRFVRRVEKYSCSAKPGCCAMRIANTLPITTTHADGSESIANLFKPCNQPGPALFTRSG